MDGDLFIKKMPQVMKRLISSEASDNRRSVNQEAIALLEEALVGRFSSNVRHRQHLQSMLEKFAQGRIDPTPSGAHGSSHAARPGDDVARTGRTSTSNEA